jgi:hypothetical protein
MYVATTLAAVLSIIESPCHPIEDDTKIHRITGFSDFVHRPNSE